MKRRNRSAEDALGLLLDGAWPEERATITIALGRLYELAVDARDETLKPEHLRSDDQPRAQRVRRSV